MGEFFGGEGPLDHPFFTRPFGGLFGGKSPFDDTLFTCTFDSPFSTNHSGFRKQIAIEELNPKDDGASNALQNSTPSKEVSVKNSNEYLSGTEARSFNFQRTAYGGHDGWYYTSSIGRRIGGDGVFLMEMKEEDRTVGESLHTISKGIDNKGHSVTSKQFSDGRVDSMQTLHNLQEDELTGFQECWKTSADECLPGWNDGFNLLEHTGVNNDDIWKSWVGWPHYSLESSGNGGEQLDDESQGPASRGPSRKIVHVD
ncbi:hypothetical protein OROGR_027998 [Orobanche gracilis]